MSNAALFLCMVLGNVEADVLLKNATLYDGTDQPGRIGDVAIKGDRIVAVGTFDVQGRPGKILDCTGLILTPGFIDLHTHSDTPLTKKETAGNANFLLQGVTTVVTGNCGFGPENVADYFKTLETQGIGSNVIHQVPHNAVRTKVMGNANREPSPAELKRMEDLVDQGMRDGAWGFATGLIYNPGTYCKTEELVALAKVAAAHQGFYASHIRDENTGIFAALEEVLTIARKAGLRVHVSHIKVSGQNVWGKSPDVIGLIRKARKEGVEITADQYPYIASSTSLAATVIPAKYREGKSADFFKKLADPEEGAKIRKAIAAKMQNRNSGASLKIASYPPQPEWQGKSLKEIADKEKKDLIELILEIHKKGGASIVSFGMNEEDVRLFMKEPYVATASDGSSMNPAGTVPHPRSYGTFPRKIGRYALEDKIITLEHALRSANGLPADILKLPQRGYLKAGYVADIVVLDPKTFRDQATFDKPHQYATGAKYVFVNGQMAVEQEKYLGNLPGKVLRHQEK